MHQVKSIGVLQTSKVIALVYATMAIVFAVLFAANAVYHGHPLRALLVLILIPVAYGVVVWLITAFGCWLYNQVARRVGGVEFELTSAQSEAVAADA